MTFRFLFWIKMIYCFYCSSLLHVGLFSIFSDHLTNIITANQTPADFTIMLGVNVYLVPITSATNISDKKNEFPWGKNSKSYRCGPSTDVFTHFVNYYTKFQWKQSRRLAAIRKLYRASFRKVNGMKVNCPIFQHCRHIGPLGLHRRLCWHSTS